MKKQYFKPEAVSVNFVVSNFLATSGGNKLPVDQDGPKVPSASGSSRGEWGNLW
jgi:hypothetical protein